MLAGRFLPQRPPPKRERPAGEKQASRPAEPGARTVRGQSAVWRRRLLWSLLGLVVVVIGVRGVSEILAGPADRGGGRVVATTVASDQARAFAAYFARTYLTYSPLHPDRSVEALRGLLAPGLQEDVAVAVPSTGHAQHVTDAWVARAQRLGGGRALITVACVVAREGRAPSVRYLAVPVFEGAGGGLVVDDYPSFASQPVTIDEEAPTAAALASEDAPAIEALLTRFFAEYLRGKAVAPEFFSPGVTVAPLGHAYAFEQLVSVGQDAPAAGASRRIVALVRARDRGTDAAHTLRYHLEVTFRDQRWLVNTIEG